MYSYIEHCGMTKVVPVIAYVLAQTAVSFPASQFFSLFQVNKTNQSACACFSPEIFIILFTELVQN